MIMFFLKITKSTPIYKENLSQIACDSNPTFMEIINTKIKLENFKLEKQIEINVTLLPKTA